MTITIPKTSAPISMVTWLNEAVDRYRTHLQVVERLRTSKGRRVAFTSTFDNSNEEKLISFMNVWNKDQSRVWTEAIGYLLGVFSTLGKISKSTHVPQMSIQLDRLYGVVHSTLMVGYDLCQDRQVTTLLEQLGQRTRPLGEFEEDLGARFWVEAFDIYAGVSWELVKYCTDIIQQDSINNIWKLNSPDHTIAGYVTSFYRASGGARRSLEEEQERKEKEERAKAEESKTLLEERQLLVKWLQEFVNDQGGRGHDNVKRDRQANTGQWFLDKVRSWVASDVSPVFWAEGRPGVGKSVLISHAIDDLSVNMTDDIGDSKDNKRTDDTGKEAEKSSEQTKDPKASKGPRVAYFYFDYASRDRYTKRAVYSSLLIDLVSDRNGLPTRIEEGSTAAKVKDLKEKCAKESKDPSPDELQAILKNSSRNILIIFDALDEAHPEVRLDILKWIEGFKTDPKVGGKHLRVLLTARPDVIKPAIPGLIRSLSVESNNADMELYVHSALTSNETVRQVIKLKKKKKADAFILKLVTAVVTRAERMFLLVVLRVRDICAQITISDMEDAATTTDTDPGQIYTSTWNQISKLPEAQAEWAYKTISWLTFSRETLDFETFTEALAVKPGVYKLDHGRKPIAEALTQACRGLVVYDDRLYAPRLRLAHQTVQEHFLQELPKRRFVHLDISLTCLTYLTLTAAPGGRPSGDSDDDEEDDSDGDSNDSDHNDGERTRSGSTSPVPHSRDNSSHEQMSGQQNPLGGQYSSDSLDVSFSPPRYDPKHEITDWPIDLEGWVETNRRFSAYAQLYALLHLRRVNFTELQQIHASNPEKLRELEELQKTLRKVLLDFVRMVFSRQQHSTMDSTKTSSAHLNPYGMKPLHLAVLFGDLETVINVHREVYCEIDDEDEHGRTALSWALKLSSPPELIQFLLDEGADVNAPNSQGQPAFYYAGSIRSLPLLRSIFDKANGQYSKTDVLQAAAEANNTVLIELLLESGVSPNFCFIDNGRSPLLSAAREGHFDACDLLIRKDAIVTTQDRNGISPLAAAVLAKSTTVTSLILRRDPDLNMQDKSGATPLHHAATMNDLELVSLFVKKGSKIDVQDEKHRTPLMILLSSNSYLSELELLKQTKKLWPTDTSILLVDEQGQSLYHLALLKGYNELVKKFLVTASGAGINISDSRGYTPLAIAIERGYLEVIDLLLRYENIDLTVRTKRCFNLFKLAVEASRPELACKLLDIRPAWANEMAEQDIPPMWIAGGRFAFSDVCQSLLTHGCDTSAKQQPEGDTGMMLACFRGHEHIVDLLVDAWGWLDNPDKDGVIRPTVNNTGMNALHHAILGGSKEIVEKLWYLDGLGKDNCDHVGNHVLHFAVRSGRADMVELLLERGASLNVSTHSGKTPLDDAIALGKDEIISALLVKDDVKLGMRYSEQAPDIVKWNSKPWYNTLRNCVRRANEDAEGSDTPSTWLREFVTIKKHDSVTQYSPDKPYLEISVPGIGQGVVRRIVFRTVSHDQGWSDDAGRYGGSYNYSCSWFEVGVEPADLEESTQMAKRRILQYNVNASSAWRTHYNIWDHRDTSPGLQDWLSTIQGGDRVQLYAKALYPGWRNDVAEADIEIYCESMS